MTKYLSHETNNEKWSRGQQRYIQSEFIGTDVDANILDVSCGNGVGLKVFRELGFTSVFGVEYSDEKAKIASSWGYKVFNGDFHQMDFLKSNTFDVVYSSHSLEHALYPRKVISEFHRVLKDQGILKLVLPFPDKGP